jgi:hypothetical protein
VTAGARLTVRVKFCVAVVRLPLSAVNMTLETFGELERRIAPDVVCRVHKSSMVAIDKIE